MANTSINTTVAVSLAALQISSSQMSKNASSSLLQDKYNSVQQTSTSSVVSLSDASKVSDWFKSAKTQLDTSRQTFASNMQSSIKTMNNALSSNQATQDWARSVVNMGNTANGTLNKLDSDINKKLTDSAATINSYTQQIAKLNDGIKDLPSGDSSLSDRRKQLDDLVSKLNQVVGVKVSVQDNNTYNVSIDGGPSLVQGNTSTDLKAVSSSSDPSRLTLGYASKSGTTEIADSQLTKTKSTVSELLSFRSDYLDPTRNQFGQMTLALTNNFTEAMKQNAAQSSQAVSVTISQNAPTAIKNSANTGTAQATVKYTDMSKVQASDYKLSSDGTSWNVTRTSDGSKVKTSTDKDGNINFDGLSVAVSGKAAANDSFTIKAVSNVMGSLAVTVNNTTATSSATTSATTSATSNSAPKGATATKLTLQDNGNNQQALTGMAAVKKANNLSLLVATQNAMNGSSVNSMDRHNTQLNQLYFQSNAQINQSASTLLSTLMKLR